MSRKRTKALPLGTISAAEQGILKSVAPIAGMVMPQSRSSPAIRSDMRQMLDKARLRIMLKMEDDRIDLPELIKLMEIGARFGMGEIKQVVLETPELITVVLGILKNDFEFADTELRRFCSLLEKSQF